jgi:hypothetical protein
MSKILGKIVWPDCRGKTILELEEKWDTMEQEGRCDIVSRVALFSDNSSGLCEKTFYELLLCLPPEEMQSLVDALLE